MACCFSLSSGDFGRGSAAIAPAYHRDGLEGDLGGVEGDVIGGLGQGYVDGFDAGEGRGLEVGGESERVVLGTDGLGKALGVRWFGGGRDQAEERDGDKRYAKTGN